eukprot:3887590-Rhodomonas_salina.1
MRVASQEECGVDDGCCVLIRVGVCALAGEGMRSRGSWNTYCMSQNLFFVEKDNSSEIAHSTRTFCPKHSICNVGKR